jgi:hypothetical protein
MTGTDGLGRHASARPIQYQLLAVVVALQAAWLAYLCSRGWFYQDDFTLLSQAVHHGLTVDYLKQPFNGHLTPGVRLAFWILARTSKLHYAPTIVLRVVLQAIATVLLFALIQQLSRSRTTALVVTAVYAASPLLVPGTLWLASSMNLLPAQVCVLVTYLAHLRHVETGKQRWSLVAGVALLIGTGFWEKTAVTAIVLVVLSVGWLTTGSLRHRTAEQFRDLPGWVLTLGPLALFTAYFFDNDYGSSASGLPVHVALHLIWLQWSHSLWAAVIGAPWQWLSDGVTYTGVADPRVVAIALGQVAFVALLVVGWWRNRWLGVLAWTLPLVAVAAGEVLIGIGRYAAFGDLVGLQFSYAYDLAIPVAIAVALALRRREQSPTAAAEPVAMTRTTGMTHRWRTGLIGVAGVTAVVVLIGSAAVSAVTWTNRWHHSPAKAYLDSILTGLHQIGPTANLYDTDISPRIVPIISRDRRLSDLLAVTDARVSFDQGPGQPQLVTDSGRIVPASFSAVARQVSAPNSFCPTLVKGSTSIAVPLAPVPPRGAYFLRIEYFQQRPALVRVVVRDVAGNPIGLRSGRPMVDFDQQLGVVVLALRTAAPQLVTFTSTTGGASVCMSKVALGVPVPASR